MGSKERMKKLRELHFKTLASGILIPLDATPYASLLREGWEEDPNPLAPSNPLWLIKKI